MSEALDYVVTVPKNFKHPDHPGLVGLAAWAAEGDAAGEQETGQDWWFTTYGNISRLIRCVPGESRLYVVCNDLLRGYAIVTDVRYDDSRFRNGSAPVAFIRKGGAVAVTIPETITGFRGFRERWWERSDEIPFPNWRDARPAHSAARRVAKQLNLEVEE